MFTELPGGGGSTVFSPALQNPGALGIVFMTLPHTLDNYSFCISCQDALRMLTADVLTGFIHSPEVACHSQIIFVSYSVARDGTECTHSDVF